MSRPPSFVLCACLGLAACAPSSRAKEPAVEETATDGEAEATRIVGTAIDASTGEPLADVEIVAPGDLTARTDADGRFELTGLPVGTEGVLRAWCAPEGAAPLAGENRLRPLAPGKLEVVIYLR